MRAIHDLKIIQTDIGMHEIHVNGERVRGVTGVDLTVRPRDFLRVTLHGIDIGSTIVDGEAVLYVQIGDTKYRVNKSLE